MDVGKNMWLKRILRKRESVIFIILIVIGLIMTVVKPDSFATQENLFNVVKQISIVAIIAIGETYVIITGGIDLSVGYSMGLGGIVMAQLMKIGVADSVAIVSCIMVCMTVGFFNGLIITRLNLPPFIATLGSANICRGLSYIITKGFPIPVENKLINYLGNGYVGSVPVMSIVMIIMVAGSHY